jgi:hypothetical protein
MGAIYPKKPKKRKPAFYRELPLSSATRSTTAAPVIFIPPTVVAPPRIAEIECAGIG